MSDDCRGLYRKYSVRRLADRKKKHKKCEFFVLDLMHDLHAAAALDAYAASCARDFPHLAADLREKASMVRFRFAQRADGVPQASTGGKST